MTIRSRRSVRPGVRAAAFLVVALIVFLVGCTTPGAPSTPAPESTTAEAPRGEPQVIASRLQSPWSIAFAGRTALVSERDSGRIVELLTDGSHREVGSVPGVVHGGEGGLLGLAVDSQNRLYAYSTGPNGNRIQRFGLTGTPGSYGLGPAQTLLDHLPSGAIHNGGRLAFGPDGMLYAGVGDTGNGALAQDLGSLGGKILRMTPDGTVPHDNPFPGSLVYSYGHRNVEGLAWTADGQMFASELGLNTWDELNVIVAGGNYGWPVVEGRGGTDRGFRDPVQQWHPGDASPSGLTRIGGTLFLATLRGQVLRAIPVAAPSTSTPYYDHTYGRLRDVTAAPDGRLWILTDNTDGRGSPGPDDDRILAVDLGAG
ncbi:PQQ-dependent sugar dehydrogenase [Raineyella fluvialis]|uniref:PQQ-dependent sugar dehydrogenase n=1 Tax=Raineyella fluvialis TaxID=2662261 RepID=A0A5Q2FEP8_9ACTN|nr:PQQ-dependent sugar dehydrogenase [Raineyella fluvialis]QGF24287.1 PQQ-dependent sugar dehydrogenase [Raineyella fluvialis]